SRQHEATESASIIKNGRPVRPKKSDTFREKLAPQQSWEGFQYGCLHIVWDPLLDLRLKPVGGRVRQRGRYKSFRWHALDLNPSHFRPDRRHEDTHQRNRPHHGGTGFLSWTSLSSVQHTSASGTVYETINNFSASIAGPNGGMPPDNQ